MKGHFSVEWLSQSSQVPVTHQHHQSQQHQQQQPASAVPSGTTFTAASVAPVPPSPSTSGTIPESLPGFYRPCRPVHGALSQEESYSDFPHHHHNHPQRQESRNTQQCAQGQETGFNTEEEETSGYESEGGHSLSPGGGGGATKALHSPPPPALSPSSGRRPRTAFTADQINSLEKAFKRNAYLGTQDKAELCKRLNLSDKQIRNWFQNRRMKLKRTVQDALAHACQAKVASHLMQYPELQNYRPAPYPSYYAPSQDASYITPTALHHHYNPAAVTAAAAAGHLNGLPVDAIYPYNGLTGLAVAPAATTSTRMVPFQPYSHQY